MPTFYTQFKLKKRKQIIFFIFSLLLVIDLLLSIWDINQENKGKYFLRIVLLLVFIFYYISEWQASKRSFFIQIKESSIEWLLPSFYRKSEIIWGDIKWIKKELDGGITFFQESSFSLHLPLKDISIEEKVEFVSCLQQIANTRLIRLINFSK